MRKVPLLIFACLFIACAPTACYADEVVMINGDRITGTVVRKEGDELIFKTSYAGDLKIAWSKVLRVTAESRMSVVLSDQSTVNARMIGRPPPEPPSEAADTEPRLEVATPAPPPTELIAYINAGPGFDVLGVRWKGRINVGARGARGNTETEDLHIDGEAVARRAKDRYTITGTLDRGKDRDVVTKQNSRLSGKYDLFLQPTWYGYGLLTIEEDRFRDIDLRTTVGAGIGHQLIETERVNMSIEGGLNHVRANFSVAPDESYPAARWALKYERRLFDADVQFFHAHELLTDITDSERSFFRSQTGLRVPLLQRLLATAQLNADFDNKPAPGKTKSDRTYLFTLGYQW